MRWISSIACPIVLLTAGCRQDMHDQPKYDRFKPSAFFDDGRTVRPIPANTIARGELKDTDEIHTGAKNGAFLETIPVPVNLDVLNRGWERFEIYCTPCHGYLGDGDGMIARRGFMSPPNLHSDRVRQLPPGYVYQVIANGYGAMPDYGTQIAVNDRWAIVAYLRALELSQNATIGDVPPGQRQSIQAQSSQGANQ